MHLRLERALDLAFDPGTRRSSFNLAPFIVLAVLWSLVPLVIAVVIAQSRNEPAGTAVLLCIVLGWIGLAIVVAGQRRTVAAASRLVGPSPPTEPAGTSPSPAAERLRTIDELYAQSLITDEERARRRAAVLEELA